MIPLKDTIPSRSFPIVNWILIALNVLAFMGELSADAREFATLFTSMFLHGGWFHLFSNMWALYIFGDNVEDRMGPVPYLIFYLLCGLAAGMTHIYFNRNSTMPSLGASGAIAGVLGAYLLLFPHARIIALIPI